VTGLCASATEGPFITADGLTLYYNTATPPTDYEGTISVTTRSSRAAAFVAGNAIAELTPGATKGYSARSADGRTLLFESGSPTDLWETSRPDLGTPFGTPSPIAGINTSSIEQDVSITTDGTELFFASDRPGSLDLDLYVATRSCL
jgi:Tol biopolymer transport system component